MAAPMIRRLENDQDVAKELCTFVIGKSQDAIKAKGYFTVGLSGGSLVKFLCNGLPGFNPEWSKWRIFFCDERHVPFDDKECTYSQYRSNLADVPADCIYPIDPTLSVEAAAEDYVKKIRSVFPGNDLPRFDMLLLGMGPDGHTCSLFPGHPLLDVSDKVIAPISDSPKPPPARVTMTFPVINNCACAVFASCGEGKADIVQRVLEGNEEVPLPAARVRPSDGQVIWFLDKGAASKLKNV